MKKTRNFQVKLGLFCWPEIRLRTYHMFTIKEYFLFSFYLILVTFYIEGLYLTVHLNKKEITLNITHLSPSKLT